MPVYRIRHAWFMEVDIEASTEEAAKRAADVLDNAYWRGEDEGFSFYEAELLGDEEEADIIADGAGHILTQVQGVTGA